MKQTRISIFGKPGGLSKIPSNEHLLSFSGKRSEFFYQNCINRFIKVFNSLLLLLLFSLQLSAQTLPGSYTSTWLGATTQETDGKVAPPMQVLGMFVGPEGSCYTSANWDESGATSTVIRNDGSISGINFSVASNGPITANANYVYIQHVLNNNPTGWQRCNFNGAKNGSPVDVGSQVDGIAASATEVFVACPILNLIKVYDANSLAYLRQYSFTNPHSMALAPDGSLWVVSGNIPPWGKAYDNVNYGATIVHINSSNGSVIATINGLQRPRGLAISSSNTLYVAEDGTDQNIKIYSNVNSLSGNVTPTPVNFGVVGGVFQGTGSTVGTMGPLRFNHPMGVGIDNYGYIYTAEMASFTGGGEIVSKYHADGTRIWVNYGLCFEDGCSFDPTTDGVDVYGKAWHFKMDYSKGRGQEWSVVGYTHNRYKYPYDFRNSYVLDNPANTWIKNITKDGVTKKFMVATKQTQTDLQFYRFDNAADGEGLIPCAFIPAMHQPYTTSMSWPNGPMFWVDLSDNIWSTTQPAMPSGKDIWSAGNWVWSDLNADAIPQANEYSYPSGGGPNYGQVTLGDNGDIWACDRDRSPMRVHKIPFVGFTAAGVPQWDYSTDIAYALPSPFTTELDALEYDSQNDVMYIMVGNTLARYNNWNANAGNWSTAWTTATFNNFSTDYGQRHSVKNICTAGDYIFIAYFGGIEVGTLYVFNKSNGAFIGKLAADFPVYDVDGSHCIVAFKRSSGEYVISVNHHSRSCILIYRWCPSGTCITPDSQAPTAPSSLTSPAKSGISVDLSWGASTDNIGVVGYDVYNGTTKMNSSNITGTSFKVTGLTCNTSYSFTAKARDAFGNSSAASNSVSVTTSICDAIAPTAPSNLSSPSQTTTTINLSWGAATDNIGVTGYDVFDGTTKVNSSSVSGTTYQLTGLYCSKSYTLTVKAYDANGNYSPASNSLVVSTSTCPAQSLIHIEAENFVFKAGDAATKGGDGGTVVAFIDPGDYFDYSNIDILYDGTFNLKFRIATGNSNVVVLVKNTAGTTLATVNIPNQGWAAFQEVVAPVNLPFGNLNLRLEVSGAGFDFNWWEISAGSGSSDTQAPTAPAGLASSAIASTSFTLSWSASTDNVGVTGYDVYQGATLKGSTATTSFSVTGLTASTAYSMTVKAKDATGNVSAASSALSVTTSAPTPDTQAPTGPSGLASSNIAQTSFTLSWTASTDNVGVTGYDVYQGATLKGSTATTSFSVTGLTASTAYSMTVRAKDAAGNVSAASSALSVTTIAASTGDGKVQMEKWTRVSGTLISDIPTTAANSVTDITSLQIPSDADDNYAIRIRGYIIPSTTGTYNLYIASDDNGDLWLSTNDLPANKARIAYHTDWTSSQEWTKFATQKSANVSLTAGQKYYFEALMKEGGGGDNLAIGWTGPGISTVTVIGTSNISSYSTTTDVTAATVPTSLASSAITATSFTLSWAASTDAVGVTGYDVYQGATLKGSSTTTSFSVTGLTASTAYSMTVKAKDAAGNVSAASSALSVTTSTASDVTAPTVPTALASSAITTTSFTLSWTASTDNVGVTGYEVFAGSTSKGTTTSTSLNVTDLNCNTAYSMTVKARDAAGNWSAASPTLSVATSGTCTDIKLTGTQFDNITPWSIGYDGDMAFDGNTTTFVDANMSSGAYTGLDFGTAKTINTIKYYPRASWADRMVNGKFQGSNDNTNWTDVATITTTPTYAWNSITTNVSYRYMRYLGPNSGYCNVAEIEFWSINGGSFDTQAPSIPTGLASSAITATSFTLSWIASTDAVGVTGYDVYQGATLKGSSTTTSFSVTGLTASTAYSMTVKAKDAAGNISAASSASSVTTSAASDVTAPTVPTALASSAITTTSFTLSWTASTDNVGVTGYEVFAGSTSKVTTASTSMSITGLTASTSYSMTVKARDAAGNWSASSSALSVTTSGSGSCTDIKLTGTQFDNISPIPGIHYDGNFAFDSNTATFVDANMASDGYTGLDFGSDKTISTIKYYPRASWANRMVNGKFQGSNDNTNWTDVATISTTPAYSWSSIATNVSYRYMRYLGPRDSYCNVAEIEFWGGCALKSAVINEEVTPINPTSNDFTINMFPNPLTSGDVLRFSGENIGNAQVIVTDLQGKVIYLGKINEELSGIPINFGKGVYVVSIKTEQQIVNKILIIN